MRINPKKLGENIKKLRKQHGVSQEVLAIKANIRLSNLAKLEGGFNSNPTLQTLASIAGVLTRGSIDALLK